MRTALLALVPLAVPVAAQDWPNWRGPNYDGSTDARGLPATFSRSENVRWSTPLPGPGAGTPVILGDAMYLSSTDFAEQELVALRLDATTGDVVWSLPVGSGYQPGNDAGSKLVLHDRSNYASPSAVADDERAIFFFGNGDLVCLSADGERQWAKNVQEEYGDFAFQWTFSATPTLWEGRLHLPVLQRDEPVRGIGAEGAESFLLAFDPATGEELYKIERPSPAVVESRESYATMIPYVGDGGRKELIVMGGDVLTGHDPATGTELWRWGTYNPDHREQWWRVVPSAVVGGGVALACGPKKAPVFAIELGGKGALGEGDVRWQSEGRRDPVTTDVPTPLYYQDHFYVLGDGHNALTKVDAKTGDAAWSTELPGRDRWRSSPTGADGRVWLMNHGGLVVVVDADSGEIVHQVEMGEDDASNVRASIAVAHGSLYFRTNAAVTRVCAAAEVEETK